MHAVQVEGLSKKYVISHARERYLTFREALYNAGRRWAARLSGHAGRSGREVDEFWALKDVSFTIAEGERLAVIGRNGAGKSTLLKILSRITEPTAGRALLAGRVASLLEVGTGFHPELTGRENIFLSGAILGMNKAEIRRKLDSIVAFSEIERFLDTAVKRYSSGMYVRLAFAVAAYLEPDILIVDEVLAVGDLQFQRKCLGRMEDAGKEGRTVLFVSHNMAAVRSLCTRGILLERGQIKAMGSVEEVVGAYVSSDTQGRSKNEFVRQRPSGRPPVEILDLEIHSGGLRRTVVCGAGTQIRIAYQCARAGMRPQFLIGVYDSFSTRVLFLDTSLHDWFPPLLPLSGTVYGELTKEFSLFPGLYRVNIAACIDGEVVDHVQGAIDLEVDEGDFFGSGKLPSGKPLALVKQAWKVVESEH